MGVPGRRNGVVHYVSFQCVFCSKPVTRRTGGQGRGRFCSRSCAAQYGAVNRPRTAVVRIVCPGCREWFDRWQSDTERIHCSRACRARSAARQAPMRRTTAAATLAALSANRRAESGGSGGNVRSCRDRHASHDREAGRVGPAELEDLAVRGEGGGHRSRYGGDAIVAERAVVDRAARRPEGAERGPIDVRDDATVADDLSRHANSSRGDEGRPQRQS